MAGERNNGVTYIKYKRFLQTNEPVNDIAIPLDREVNVIAAIGPLNSRTEANSHSHSGDDHTTDDIKMDFSAKNEHSCTSSLYDRKGENTVEPWPTRKLSGQNVITVRIGPTGGKRGYSAITGAFESVKVSRELLTLDFVDRSSIMGNRMVLERSPHPRADCRAWADLHIPC